MLAAGNKPVEKNTKKTGHTRFIRYIWTLLNFKTPYIVVLP